MTLSTKRALRGTLVSLAMLGLVVFGWLVLAMGSGALSRWLPAAAIWIPLGIFGLIRWSVWLGRRIPAAMYRPITTPYSTTASIVVPVYQEDPDVFRLALESWRASNPDELILVIDATDTACIEIAKGVPEAIVDVTDVPGKRQALARGVLRATSEIVVLVDSDTILKDDALVRILRPFRDPKIGGVGTRQRVLKPTTFWQRIAQIYLDIRYDVEAPAMTRIGRAVSCLSGRTAAYRRALLVPLLPEFLDERFLGKLCVTGEDKRLTSLVLRAGFDTYHQDDAVVWSTFAPDFATFMKQRIRWTRNTYRSDLRALWEGWIWQRPYLAFMLVDRLISPYALLLGLTYFVASLLVGAWGVAVALGAWWILSRGLKLASHLRREPRDLLILPQYIALTFLMAAVKVYALATVHHHRWLTRGVELVNGEVVRHGSGRRDQTALPIRAAGLVMAITFAGVVSLAFATLGGLSFAREDTAPPIVRVNAPRQLVSGESALLVATAVDRTGGPLQYIWTWNGAYLGDGQTQTLPDRLEPGTHHWVLHVRDPLGNTASAEGTIVVDGAAAAASPPSEPAAAVSATPAPTQLQPTPVPAGTDQDSGASVGPPPASGEADQTVSAPPVAGLPDTSGTPPPSSGLPNTALFGGAR